MTKTFFFYGDVKIEVDHERLNGLQIKEAIKAEVPSIDLGFELVLEGHGNDADEEITDAQELDLAHSHGGPKRFSLRPPTRFGAV